MSGENTGKKWLLKFISIPDHLVVHMRATIPTRQHSKTITSLIEKEIEKPKKVLYEGAVSVEKDFDLLNEIKDWHTTLYD